MKMKKNVMLFVGALLASSALTEERMMTILSLDKVEVISLHFGSLSWYVRFISDGSGYAYIAGGGPIGVPVSAGTFSFEEIYNLLVPHLKPNYEYIEDIGVLFDYNVSTKGNPIRGGGFLENTEAISKLILLLRDKMEIRDTGQLDDLLLNRPLFPGYDADGNPIPGYVRTPYVKMPECLDPFADDPPAPKDGNAENATPQEARKTGPDNGEAQTPLPDREALQPDAPDSPNSKVATASLPLEDGAQRLEAAATTDTPPSRLWLYVGILSALCAGVALWFIRRKRR